jgi:hypothetical protein
LSAPTRTDSTPAEKLRIGILSMLASFPLFFILGVLRGFAVILFLAGLIIYFDGLVQNRKWEKAKKQAAAIVESTRRGPGQAKPRESEKSQMPRRFQNEYR